MLPNSFSVTDCTFNIFRCYMKEFFKHDIHLLQKTEFHKRNPARPLPMPVPDHAKKTQIRPNGMSLCT